MKSKAKKGDNRDRKIISIEFTPEQYRWLQYQADLIGASKGFCLRDLVQKQIQAQKSWTTSFTSQSQS